MQQVINENVIILTVDDVSMLSVDVNMFKNSIDRYLIWAGCAPMTNGRTRNKLIAFLSTFHLQLVVLGVSLAKSC